MRFGVREICNVTFKALDAMKVGSKTFAKGEPVFMIETATTSTMEQGTSVVYAQGGQGYNRLISWEGEKTLTFTVTDALMSAMGMRTLTGAGLIDASKDELAHFHVALDVAINAKAGKITLEDLQDELGLDTAEKLYICADTTVPIYASAVDSAGSVVDYLGKVTPTSVATTLPSGGDGVYEVADGKDFEFTVAEACDTAKIDFYVVFESGVKTIEIEPNSFGGYFYVEADTLFRNETTGKDMAASLVFPKVKVQSAFTFTMAATGDPSTFDFVMDAFPARTMFSKKKVLVDMQVIEGADITDTDLHTEYDKQTHSKN